MSILFRKQPRKVYQKTKKYYRDLLDDKEYNTLIREEIIDRSKLNEIRERYRQKKLIEQRKRRYRVVIAMAFLIIIIMVIYIVIITFGQ